MTENETFAQDVEEVLGDEQVEAVVLGERGYSHLDKDREEPRLMEWAEARPLLDYEYDSGFGGADCHAIYLWTPTRVIFVGTYDGSTWVTAVPRNPVAERPETVGGG